MNTDKTSVVDAPAFSITKVMAVVAPVVTAVTASATTWLGNTTFTAGEITTLIVALVAFLALTGSSDVMARGMATSAEKRAAGGLKMVRFDPPLAAKLDQPGPDEDVKAIAVSDAAPPQYLCLRADGSLSWCEANKVRF